jgi:hypothetical protein
VDDYVRFEVGVLLRRYSGSMPAHRLIKLPQFEDILEGWLLLAALLCASYSFKCPYLGLHVVTSTGSALCISMSHLIHGLEYYPGMPWIELSVSLLLSSAPIHALTR